MEEHILYKNVLYQMFILCNTKRMNYLALTVKQLKDMYTKRQMSALQIARALDCSPNKINYWLAQYNIKKRTISEAVYVSYNPDGDPFLVKNRLTKRDVFLKGLGLGLYWGEGTKANKSSIRLGNTDPYLIKAFIIFLEEIYGIPKSRLQFGLQVFNDMDDKKALKFWRNHLNVSKNQFQKVIITPARSLGTYRNKTKYGVLTIYFNNVKLRKIIGEEIEQLKNKSLGSSVG